MNNKSKKQANLDREDAWMSITETTVLAIAATTTANNNTTDSP
jgi:hypothetical protein